jgi:ABC-type nitrate/sulfonate/bicarbonate transport system substrate-binding protein
MYGAFKDKGIEPEKINLQFVASYHERIMAARRGLVGLIVLPRMQYLEAKEAGMKNILEFHTFLPTFPSYVLVGSKNWVQKNKDLLTKFLMGQIKAQWFINHNLDESVRLLAEIFIKEPDRNLIKEVTYHRVSNGLIPATAMIDIDTYKKGITLFREYGLKIKAYGDLISELIQKTVNLKFLSKAKINLCKKCWPLPSCPPK